MLRIENVVQLTRGELDSSVSISYFEQLQPFAKKIKMGDLFIAFNNDDIAKAISNGAHGILCECEDESFGQDVAWIRVRDIKKAAFDLLKYELLGHRCKYIVCEPIIFSIAKELINDEGVLFINPQNPENLFEKLNLPTTIHTILSFDEQLLQYLGSDEQQLFHTPRKHNFTVRKSSVLSSEIIWGEIWHVPYPEILLKYIWGAIQLAKEIGIVVKPINLSANACFEPYFVSKGIYESSYGKTSQVIIFSRFASNALLRDIVEFINNKTTWGERLYVFPISRVECKPRGAIITNYGSLEELHNLLEDGTFCYALVADANKSDVLVQNKPIQLSLFE